MIRADCPRCGRAADFADFLAGLAVVCKNCGQRMPLPSARRTSEAITAAPAAASPDTVSAGPPPQASTEAIQAADVPLGTDGITPCEPRELRSIAKSFVDASLLPAWAIEHAVASLRVGLKVPQIEQRLVDRGLMPEVAASVVNSALERQLGEQPAPAGESAELLQRALSFVVAGACLLLAYWFGGGTSVGRTIL